MLNQIKKQSGFTIIELLIVIAIIGILATLVLTNFQGAQAKGRDTVRKNDINSLYQKLEEYYNENGSYVNEAVTVANASTLFPGIDGGAVTDEDGTIIDTQFTDGLAATGQTVANTGDGGEYELELFGAGCTDGNTDKLCIKYVLAAFQETDTANPYKKTSLN